MATLQLTEGTTVETRNGMIFLIVGSNLTHPTHHYIPLEEYNEYGENLTNDNYDIVKAERRSA